MKLVDINLGYLLFMLQFKLDLFDNDYETSYTYNLH